MSINTKRGVFPLHLTPFESYMFVDDHPGYPMTFVVQFEFIGDIDRTVFQTSIDRAFQRHPMLRAIIQPAKSSRDCWVLPEESECLVNWGELDDPILINGAGETINLREHGGLRCWVRHNREQAVFTAVFHHSAVDGIGAYHFLGDALWFYSKHFDANCGELAEFNDQDLRKRLKANINSQFLMNQADDGNLVHENAQPLAAVNNTTEQRKSPHHFPQFQSRTFDKDEYRNLRLKAQENGQNVNDVLLESLLTALCSWNEMQGADIEARDFCILMPLDLRTQEQPVFSATNVVTSSFVRRTAREIKDKKQLSTSLREEIVKIKHSRHDSEFMRLLLQSPIDWRVAESSYDFDACHSTAIFSNAGDPTRRFLVDLPRDRGVVKCGNLVLEDLSGASPIRNLTRVAVNIFTYRRRLKICMRFDPQCFSNADGKAFMDHFVKCFIDSSEE